MIQDKRPTLKRRLVLEAMYTAAVLSCVVFGSASAWAQDATWDGDAGNNWNSGSNWNPAAVPTDEAFFNEEGNDQAAPTLTANANINSILFQAGAGNYDITTNGFRLSVNGSGVTNSSGVLQQFSNSGVGSTLRFQNSATISAGIGGIEIVNGNNGATVFLNSSSAGDARIVNGANGVTRFRDNSSAGNATISNDGANALTNFVDSAQSANAIITNSNGARTRFEDTSGASGTAIVNSSNGTTRFEDSSQAGGGTQISNFTDGLTVFEDTSTADAVTIINYSGGRTRFDESATGNSNTTLLNGVGGALDISGSNGAVTIGSVVGGGNIFLGARTLNAGSQNNNETIFGAIQNGGVFGGVGGNLVKEGTGTLQLSAANTYTGTTTINNGTLQVDGSITSNTIIAANGRLTGTGSIIGDVINNGGQIVAGRGDDAVGGSNPYSELDINGNVTFVGNGADLGVRVFGGNGFGNVNEVRATGTITLDGSVVVNTQPQSPGDEYLVNNNYLIITGTGGRAGVFDGIDFGNSTIESYLDASLSYNVTSAFLNLRRNTLLDQEEDFTQNQQSLFDEFNSAIEAGAVLDADEEGLINNFIINGPGALDLASGDALTVFPIASQGAANRFNQRLMTQALEAGRQADDEMTRRAGSRLVYSGNRNLLAQAGETLTDNAATTSEYSRRSNIWATIGRAKDNGDSDGNGPGFDAKATEYQIGFNRHLSERTVLGLSVGKSDSDVDIPQRAAEGDVDSTSIGAFLRHDSDDWYLSGLLS
jgi:autotransporter-associated beta strand protein